MHRSRNRQRYKRQPLRDRRGPEATRLLAKPLAQSLLYVILRERPLLPLALEAVAHFVEDAEVVLDSLKRAVFRCSVSPAE